MRPENVWDNQGFAGVDEEGVLGALSYELVFEKREGYLYARVNADEISFEMVIEYTNKMVQELKAGDYSRLLLHTNTPVLESTDCYEIASYIIRNGVSRDVKIAVVDSIPGHAIRQERISIVSRTAGLDLKSFDSVEAGEAWLLQGTNGKTMGAH